MLGFELRYVIYFLRAIYVAWLVASSFWGLICKSSQTYAYYSFIGDSILLLGVSLFLCFTKSIDYRTGFVHWKIRYPGKRLLFARKKKKEKKKKETKNKCLLKIVFYVWTQIHDPCRLFLKCTNCNLWRRVRLPHEKSCPEDDLKIHIVMRLQFSNSCPGKIVPVNGSSIYACLW